MNQHNITGIIVAYLPNSEILTSTVESLSGQVDKLIIVDNTPGGSDVLRNGKPLSGRDHIELITLHNNFGTAGAQNVGIKKALANGADFILLSDQDTHYPDRYTSRMLQVYEAMAKERNIAAVVPDFAELNRGGERQGFMVWDGIFLKRIHTESGCYDITQAIASGMIISQKAFDVIGLMDEKLFIDWVDFEWCWRARAKGFSLVGCADIVIQHSLGDVAKKVGLRSYPVRSPVRHYYIIRNGIFLALRDKDITLGMRMNILAKSFRYFVGFTTLGKPHGEHFAYCLKGFYHGIIGRLGAYR